MTSSSGLRAQNILVFGATGAIGTRILYALIDAKSHFERIAVFTSPATVERKAAFIASIKNKGVEIITGNVRDEADVLSAYQCMSK